jgi:two-component system, chemotaxis family, sensor kinase CheA
VLCDLRDGDLQVTPEAVTLILNTLDQLKIIISVLQETGLEPDGDDTGLIVELNAMAAPVARADTAFDNDGMIDLGPPAADDESMIDLGLPAVDDIPLETMPLMAEANAPESPTETAQDAPPREIAAAAQNIRVSVNLLENLITMVYELVLTQNQLMQTMRNEQSSAFTGPLQRLNHITSELQEGVMKTRMQPIGNAWNKLPLIVRALSQDLGKQVELEMNGAETELGRQVIEIIKDPLTHMVRNSCDHGLESSAERLAVGKPETGQITL